ncbi:hypothetical protein [Jannaschia faecimaris]|nr:hypothetical protein [Jannaschia faecimaris]
MAHLGRFDMDGGVAPDPIEFGHVGEEIPEDQVNEINARHLHLLGSL